MSTIRRISILKKQDSIIVGYALQDLIVQTLLQLKTSRFVLITDTNLSRYVEPFQKLPNLLVFQVPPGEGSKSRAQKAEIEDWMFGNGCTRDSVLIALGGGVVGDLVGFVAATFMRGIRFVQIPTTLLAMVDSSIGGKTAIDTPHGKNLIGSFWQPEFTFIDVRYLVTLPQRELANGMAEVIKTAAIWDAAQFLELESSADEILSITNMRVSSQVPSVLISVITSSISVKAHIVTVDERETGLRNLVNFGHTIGHAIEALLTPDLLHGECVSIGMILEAEVSRGLGHLNNNAVGRLERCLKSYGLPTSLDDDRVRQAINKNGASITSVKLLEVMKLDKKNAGKDKKIVLLSRIGKTYEPRASIVSDDLISRIISSSIQLQFTSVIHKAVTLRTPGSKSISNRALLLAALGQGECRLHNLLASNDTEVMMDGLTSLGAATFRWETDPSDGTDVLVVRGNGGALAPPRDGKHIYVGNAGTAMRFLTSAVCLISATNSPASQVILTGNDRMKHRPIEPLITALRENGVNIKCFEKEGYPPLSIGTTGLKGGMIRLSASISSQYVSSILMAAPYAQEEVVLELIGGAVISQPYIDMTIAMMRKFGVNVERLQSDLGEPRNCYRIPLGVYGNPQSYRIESDASSATYPLAIAAITGSACTVTDIGVDSLQGDAKFAELVLRPMGCTVSQTSNTITVTGPPIGNLKSLPCIDMETMTDAFLTGAVLAAVATSSPSRTETSEVRNMTRIVGIANQRVKECNRILAMKTELTKFGVRVNEIQDGLEIFGCDPGSLVRDVSVHTYDDHRVAMAFSVLACASPKMSTVIEDKRCVSKTWPSWWDDLARFGVTMHGHDDTHAHLHTNKYDPNASIVLIGMRGAGKTTVGKFGAAALRRPFLDADQYFEDRVMNVREYVKLHGWKEFRVQELRLLKECLENMSKGYVISLGGGIVESEEARHILKEYGQTRGPVVHVKRDIHEIIDFLNSETHRPSLGEPLNDIWDRRKPWLDECSTYDVINYVGGRTVPSSIVSIDPSQFIDAEGRPLNLLEVQLNDGNVVPKGGVDYLTTFFRLIAGVSTESLDLARDYSSLIALTFPVYSKDYPTSPSVETLDEVVVGVDAVELRVDLLSPSGSPPTVPHIPPLEFVATQLAALRYNVSLPVVFTVRTESQGGLFPDDAVEEYFNLLKLGRRLGCELIDLEVRWPDSNMTQFINEKGNSLIVASWHDWSGQLKWDSKQMRNMFMRCSRYGDIVKIISRATCAFDNIEMLNFRGWAKSICPKPLISLNMGREGQLSRILCPCLTFVTHPFLPAVAAPGQLTFLQIQQGRELAGMLVGKTFYLFGTPIQLSKSPLIHNTGFQKLGLPHIYLLHECAVVDQDLAKIIRSPDFGGASVTIPHKVDIIPLLDEITDHAKTIGAVNTIIPIDERGSIRLVGDNTDWLGIMALIETSILPSHCISPSCTALVIGAGGTSRAAIYALYQYGFRRIYVYNRTLQRAITVANSFGPSYSILPLDSLTQFPHEAPAVIISTVPASAQRAAPEPTESTEDGVNISPNIFSRQEGGIVIDLAYMPFITPLLDLARTQGTSWVLASGIEILLEQGFKQFSLWTGKVPPKKLIRETVLREYHSEQLSKFSYKT